MNIPSSTKRKLLSSFRAMYTTGICLICSLYWDWGIGLTFLSAVISSITGAYTYLGQLQFYLWRITWSGTIGACFGLLAGYYNNYPFLMFIIILIGVTIINRCSLWDHLPKVIGTLNIVLASLRPLSVNKSFIGYKMFKVIMSVTYFPIVITFITLLLPYPALAIYYSKDLMSMISKKLSSMSTALLQGFYSQDYRDIYQSKYEHLNEQLQSYLEKLTVIEPFISYEMILFPSIHPTATSLHEYIEIMKELLNSLGRLKDMLSNINVNQTHEIFASNMNTALYNISTEIMLCLRLIYEYYNDILVISSFYDNFNIFNLIKRKPKIERRNSLLDELVLWEDSYNMLDSFVEIDHNMSHSNILELMLESLKRLDEAQASLLESLLQTRNRYIYNENIVSRVDSSIENYVDSKINTNTLENRLNESYLETKIDNMIDTNIDTSVSFDTDNKIKSNKISCTYEKVENSFDGETEPFHSNSINKRNESNDKSADDTKNISIDKDINLFEVSIPVSNIDDYSPIDGGTPNPSMQYSNNYNSLPKDGIIKDNNIDVISQAIKKENMTIRNLSPRGAYVQRICDIIKIIHKLPNLVTKPSERWSPLKSFYQIVIFGYEYVSSILYETIYNFQTFLYRPYQYLKLSKPLIQSSDYDFFSKYIHLYSQPFKIGLSVAIAALFVIIPKLRRHYANGIWAGVTIAFIRQESTSSSFLIGYQRLEGTIIGAVFAFLASSALQCSSNESKTCSPGLSFTVLLIWLGICAYFREGPRHGYASFVAGFTPIVLIAGPFQGNMTNAWSRVLMTLVGVAIFIIIDNTVLPIRTDDNIRTLVVEAINDSSTIFKETLLAVEVIVSIEENGIVEHIISCKSNSFDSSNHVDDNIINSNEDIIDKKNPNESIVKLKDIKRIQISKSFLKELSNPQESIDIFNNHLNIANETLNKLAITIRKFQLFINFAVHEPEVWTRPFPIQCYTQLLGSLSKLHRSGKSICSGVNSLKEVLYNTNISSNQSTKNIFIHLKLFSFITNRLFSAISTTTTALKKASNEMKRFYETNDYNIDLKPLLSLTRYFNRLVIEIDEYFSTTYRSAIIGLDVNIYFLIAWQNVSESVFDMINSLSDLGYALHRVQNMELLAQT